VGARLPIGYANQKRLMSTYPQEV